MALVVFAGDPESVPGQHPRAHGGGAYHTGNYVWGRRRLLPPAGGESLPSIGAVEGVW